MRDFEAILGAPGTGKSYRLLSKLEANPAYAIKTSSSGISAVNIGGTTVHSTLGYFNTVSLLHHVVSGKILKRLEKIALSFERLCIDEISMLPGQDLDLIVTAIDRLEALRGIKLGLEVSGDLGQLEAVEGSSFIEAKCWPRFNVTQLTEVKRQENKDFVHALMLVRAGRAGDAADWFESKVGFNKKPDLDFLGTTFFPDNTSVDRYNLQALSKLQSVHSLYPKELERLNKTEWNNIPKALKLKVGSKVLIKVNKLPEYANGDLAVVEELFAESVLVKLIRTGKSHLIGYAKLTNEEIGTKKELGVLHYLPLRLADGATIHSSQGLSLEAVQLCFTNPFLSRLSGGLCVGLSRCRTPEGLRLVGTKDQFIKSCYVNPKYKPYLALPEFSLV